MNMKALFCCLVDQSRGLRRSRLKTFHSQRLARGASSGIILPDRSLLKHLLDNAFVGADIGKEFADPWFSSPFATVVRRRFCDEKAASTGTNPDSCSVLLFPGQATHFVGMGSKLLKYPNVKELFARASEILKYDLLKMCLEGPLRDLEKTIHSQPAIFVTSVAALEKLRDDSPLAVENCVAAAGYSIGEYAALVFSGALTFESALNIVKVRAERMQAASESELSGMATVFEHFNSDLNGALEASRVYMKEQGHPNPVCQISAYLFPECKVIGGHEQALKFLEHNANHYKIRVKRLATSGAFHTPLMDFAATGLKSTIEGTKFNKPLISVYSNVTACPYKTAAEIPMLLLQQLSLPVKWEQIMHIIYDRKNDSYPSTFEPGPGRQLGSMLRKMNLRAFNFYSATDV